MLVEPRLQPGSETALVHRVTFGWVRAGVGVNAVPVEDARKRMAALSFAVPKV